MCLVVRWAEEVIKLALLLKCCLQRGVALERELPIIRGDQLVQSGPQIIGAAHTLHDERARIARIPQRKSACRCAWNDIIDLTISERKRT